MNHNDHVNLLHGGIPAAGGLWADLGSGAGAFTLALADLIGSSGQIISIDQDGSALRQQECEMQAHFPAVQVRYQQADFTRQLDLPPLDGIVMANSLHFHRNKAPILRQIRETLKPGGRFILVEYNVDRGNTWVPYPFSYPTWEQLAREAGFSETRMLGCRPSRFLHEIYSAISLRPAAK